MRAVQRTGGACYGEPAFRHEEEDYELAGDFLDGLYDYSADFAEGSITP